MKVDILFFSFGLLSHFITFVSSSSENNRLMFLAMQKLLNFEYFYY